MAQEKEQNQAHAGERAAHYECPGLALPEVTNTALPCCALRENSTKMHEKNDPADPVTGENGHL